MKFSITIPAYKAKFLYDAIDSVLKQTYSDFELIIVDDCSPEDLKSIVDEFSDSRIRYYRNTKNCGAVDVVDNWNICLSYCTGEYVICMGDDDRLLPCCLEEYVLLIKKYPEVCLLHAFTEIIDDNGNIISFQQPRPDWESALSLAWWRWNGRRQFIGDFCFRTKELRDEGGFHKFPLAWASDDVSAVKAARHYGVANTYKSCFQYRVSVINISNTGKLEVKFQSKDIEEMWYKENLGKMTLKGIPSGDLDMDYIRHQEQMYLKLFRNSIENHFRIEKKKMMRWEFENNHFLLFKFFKLAGKDNNISLVDVIKSWVDSF